MEKSKKPSRECFLYGYQLGIKVTQNICTANGQGIVYYAYAKRWFKRFRNVGFCLKDDLTSGSPMEIDLAELEHGLEN